MSLQKAGQIFEEALEAYDFGETIAGVLRFGKGHINDTFAVYTQREDGSAKRFILQRINTHVFTKPHELMENIIGVTEHLRGLVVKRGGNPDAETLTVLRTKNGLPYYTAQNGDVWRAYLFIENAVCYQTAKTPELFNASAKAFGNFVSQMASYDASTLHETIEKFHDTRVRYENLARAVKADKMGRAAQCKEEIEFALARKEDCAVLMDMLDAGKLPLRVTHNDTKLNNIMMNPVTTEGVCVIDLDTVMPGLTVHDFGDSIRFGANTAEEDEQDLTLVKFSIPLYQTYTEGFLETAGNSMTSLEKEMMPWGAKLMTLECGMRFLTDFLEGDVYFHIAQPLHNLYRARTQFKLVQEMEDNWQQMNDIVNK
jgi:hypothetical protein